MSDRKVYHVEPAPGWQAGWNVKEENHGVVAHYENKDEATEEATRLAKRHPLGQVKIHDQSGRFQEERTYGDDPRRSPG